MEQWNDGNRKAEGWMMARTGAIGLE